MEAKGDVGYGGSSVVGRRGALQRLASLRLTLWLFVLFALAIGGYFVTGRRQEWWIAVPLLLFALNLLAAIVVQPRFRHQPPLLTFHIALLVLVVLVALGRLSYLNGELEVTSGSAFNGQLSRYRAGPLHPWRVDEMAFVLERFSIDYDAGGYRGATRCVVSWPGKDGEVVRGVVGDHYPLLQAGYRLYTTHNKGFAALFAWQPQVGEGGPLGSIHFPPYPAREFAQAQRWSPPGTGRELWMQLQFDEVIIDPVEPSQFRAPQEHRLVVRDGGRRHVLRPGETLQLPEGRLHYRGLTTWMGFRVSSDWTLPWLLAAGLLAALAMGWHYWKKFAARPWLADNDLGE